MKNLRAPRVGAWIRRLRFAAVLACCFAGMHVHAAAPTADWNKIFEIVGDLKKVLPDAKLQVDPDSALGQAAGAVEAVLGVAKDVAAGKGPQRCSAWKTSKLKYSETMMAAFDNFQEDLEFLSEPCACQMLCIDVVTPDPGGMMKFWQGQNFMEVVREPGCSPLYGETGIIEETTDSAGGRDGFYHVHIHPNPALLTLALAMEVLCHTQAFHAAVMPFYSELDLTWNPGFGAIATPGLKEFVDEQMRFNWKDVLAGDPVILGKKLGWALSEKVAGVVQVGESVLCVAECLAITAGFEPFSFPPFDNCSGCNGLVVPYTGEVTAVGGRRAAELVAHRAIKLQVNRLLWQSTTIEKCNGAIPMPGGALFPKNDFRLQMLHPEDDRKEMRKLGAIHVPVWDESGKQGELLKQDYVFQIWKRRTCCATVPACPRLPLPYV